MPIDAAKLGLKDQPTMRAAAEKTYLETFEMIRAKFDLPPMPTTMRSGVEDSRRRSK
jgi:hypothetical protein